MDGNAATMTSPLVSGLARAIDDLQQLDLHAHSDDDLSALVLGLQVQRSRLDAATARAAHAFERRGSWALDGAKSAAAWLSSRCRVPIAAARRLTRFARSLRELPETTDALEEGRIATEHAERIARAAQGPRREAMDRDEAMLVGHAEELPFREFHKAVTYWEQLADPDGVEKAADAEAACRRLQSLHMRRRDSPRLCERLAGVRSRVSDGRLGAHTSSRRLPRSPPRASPTQTSAWAPNNSRRVGSARSLA